MIDYDAHRWTDHLFDWKGSMVGQILWRVLLCEVWTLGVVIAHHHWPGFGLPSTGHALIGVALGMLLVFRTNASYDRFWEGRKLWGGIVNETRNLVRQSYALIRPHDLRLHQSLVRWTALFPYACQHQLRGTDGIGPPAERLPPDERKQLALADHRPLWISVRLSELLRDAVRGGILTDYTRAMLDANIQQLVDNVGACERIRKTPLPFAYVVHLRRALILYCYTLPFAVVGEFGSWSLLLVFVIAYVFNGIEEIGVQIEEPFGEDDNDLPLEKIAAGIEQNLSALEGA